MSYQVEPNQMRSLASVSQDGQWRLLLRPILVRRYEDLRNQLVRLKDDNEIKRVQGAAQELEEFINLVDLSTQAVDRPDQKARSHF